MSNIDLTKLVTADDKARRVAEARALASKEECRRRILAVVDAATQMNLVQAMLVRDTGPHGELGEEQVATPTLRDGDVDTIHQMQVWIAAMRAACAAVAGDPSHPPAADAHWPAPPDGLAELADRF
ncbi:hypothetical protein [Roseovarius sp.]|uniref:hypothetical protein n=1 Tax=Roseovarius sp. TaxID=1486281 RepID=UPI0026277CDC|nr:hypothetical protein [Roseovarius sp.]MDM8166149.1 hypothetical protein [Roseovarius sp.]